MRLLVTGGSGALGSAICDRAEADGHEAVSFDLVAPSGPEGRAWARGDVRDGRALVDAARRHRVDAVVHMAAMLLGATAENPRAGIEVNCLGSLNVFEAARVLGLRRVVWASSATVFAGSVGPTPIPNDAPVSPQSIQGGTKILNETVAAHYYDVLGLETVGLRFGLMMSLARQAASAPVQILRTELVAKPRAGEIGRLPFPDDVVNWLWIADAARVCVLAATAPDPVHGAFNVGGDLRSLGEAIEIVRARIPGARVMLDEGARGPEYQSGFEYRMETTAIEAAVGFHPEWKLEDQIDALLAR